MDFLEILEEAFNTKTLGSKVGQQTFQANMLTSELARKLQPSDRNKRYVYKHLFGALRESLTPEKFDIYKSFIHSSDDRNNFLEILRHTINTKFNNMIGSGSSINFLGKNTIRQIIDIFPTSDYSHESDKHGDPMTTRRKVTQFKPKERVEESASPRQIISHYIKRVILYTIQKDPKMHGVRNIASMIKNIIETELGELSTNQLDYFAKGVEKQIINRNQRYKIGTLRGLLTNVQVENVATPFQKYNKKHTNTNSHQHSMRRTMGNDTDRESKTMVPRVRKDLKTPYQSSVANVAQNQTKILTPFDIRNLEQDYQIDFSDRRVKTIKGKTNMMLVPLQNGGWKLEHK